MSEEPKETTTHINTGGGAYIAGNVDTGGGDFVVRDKYEIHMPASRKDARERRDQLILLDKVRKFWVEGVLEKSLHQAVLIELGKESRPDLISHPWETVVELPEQKPTMLPSGKSITEIFDEAGRSLLILGQPGSGKTITMLELARDLLDRAEKDPTEPVPVVLNLSTWGERRLPFTEWVVKELLKKYQIPTKKTRKWIADFDLLLLLDGVDEVRQEYQDSCLQSINQFGEEHGLSGITVCSRIADYAGLKTKLKLGSAIYLQPLKVEQINAYFSDIGGSLKKLQESLAKDPVLRELAQTPLMLSIMGIAYQNLSVNILNNNDLPLAARREQILDTYIRQMFVRKRLLDKPYSLAKTLKYLKWLGSKMNQASTSEFHVALMQPYLLTGKISGLLFQLLLHVLIGGGLGVAAWLIGMQSLTWFMVFIFVGMVLGAFVGIYQWNSLRFDVEDNFKEEGYIHYLSYILAVFLILGCVFYTIIWLTNQPLWNGIGLIALPICIYFFYLRFLSNRWEQNPLKSGREFFNFCLDDFRNYFLSFWVYLSSLFNIFLWMIIFSGAIMIIGLILFSWSIPSRVATIIVAILFGIYFVLRHQKITYESQILPIEKFSWSWIGAIRGFFTWIIPALILGIIFGLLLSQVFVYQSLWQIIINNSLQPTAIEQINQFPEPLTIGKYGAIIFMGLLLPFGSILGGITPKLYKVVDRKLNISREIYKIVVLAILVGGVAFLSFFPSAIFTINSITQMQIAILDDWSILSQQYKNDSQIDKMSPEEFSGIEEGFIPLIIRFVEDSRYFIWMFIVRLAIFWSVIAFFWFGGVDLIAHLLLRLFLAIKKAIPWNYIFFLDFATDLIFLRNVGGGYIFIHRILQEHFAELDVEAFSRKIDG